MAIFYYVTFVFHLVTRLGTSLNLPATVSGPAEFETKYAVDVGMVPVIAAGLKASCARDPEFPEGQVASIYFDTPSLQLLEEKRNSDYLKSKVRLRWYASSEDPQRCFLEWKRKVGSRREKDRVELSLEQVHLTEGREAYSFVERAVRHAMAELNGLVRADLFPMITIRYRRRRFIDVTSQSRISLDDEIRFSSVNALYFPQYGGRRSRHCVLEVKNSTGELPDRLRGFRQLLSPREAFSKYEECWNLYSDASYRRQLTTLTV